MPNLSRDYLSTLPSITKFIFYTSLIFTLFLSAVHAPFLSYFLSESTLKAVYHYVGANSMTFPFSFYKLIPYNLYRLLTPFFLHPMFVSPTFVLSCASFITLVSYSRHIEEERLLHPAGAAKYTTALLFAAFCILTLSLSQMYSATPVLPRPPYFQTALTMVFFVATLDTTFAPYEPLSSSSVLQQWHSPYLLLILFSVLFPMAFAPCMGGILLAYAYHVLTVGVGRVWGVRLWGTPDWLVALYERFGIGVSKVGLSAMDGGEQLGGE